MADGVKFPRSRRRRRFARSALQRGKPLQRFRQRRPQFQRQFLRRAPRGPTTPQQFRGLTPAQQRNILRRTSRGILGQSVRSPRGQQPGGGGGGQPPRVPPQSPEALPPPVLPSAEAARQAALNQFNITEAGSNRAIYEAALRLGDPALIQRFAEQGFGPLVEENPLGALSTIGREETESRRRLREQANVGNLFFSGVHQRGQTELGEQARFARLQALQDFQEAEADVARARQQAITSRDEAFAEARAREIEAALSEAPVPQAVGAGPSRRGKGKRRQGGLRAKQKSRQQKRRERKKRKKKKRKRR